MEVLGAFFFFFLPSMSSFHHYIDLIDNFLEHVIDLVTLILVQFLMFRWRFLSISSSCSFKWPNVLKLPLDWFSCMVYYFNLLIIDSVLHFKKVFWPNVESVGATTTTTLQGIMFFVTRHSEPG